MNDVLMEIVAARMSAQGRPEMAELLARLRAPGADTSQISQELLAQIGDQNPAVSQLIMQMGQSRPPKVIDVESEETAEPAFDESALNELKQSAADLFSEVQLFRDRTDKLAAALGACCLCWGEDANCRFCRGRGAPGFAHPDETMFEYYVVPAVLMMRERKQRRQTEVAELKQPGA
jgi:hypothetical protein